MSPAVSKALRFLVASVIPLTLTCVVSAPASTALTDVGVTEQVSALSNGGQPITSVTATERDADENVDLYGNGVTSAVAKYKLDADGSLYELHSPQTQLPRLGSPKS